MAPGRKKVGKRGTRKGQNRRPRNIVFFGQRNRKPLGRKGGRERKIDGKKERSSSHLPFSTRKKALRLLPFFRGGGRGKATPEAEGKGTLGDEKDKEGPLHLLSNADGMERLGKPYFCFSTGGGGPLLRLGKTFLSEGKKRGVDKNEIGMGRLLMKGGKKGSSSPWDVE